MNKAPAAPLVILLWVLGALVSAVSLVFAVISGVRECDSSAICSMSSAIEMLFSVMGVFVGALIVVGGFALQSAQARKNQDDKYREDMKNLLLNIRDDQSE